MGRNIFENIYVLIIKNRNHAGNKCNRQEAFAFTWLFSNAILLSVIRALCVYGPNNIGVRFRWHWCVCTSASLISIHLLSHFLSFSFAAFFTHIWNKCAEKNRMRLFPKLSKKDHQSISAILISKVCACTSLFLFVLFGVFSLSPCSRVPHAMATVQCFRRFEKNVYHVRIAMPYFQAIWLSDRVTFFIYFTHWTLSRAAFSLSLNGFYIAGTGYAQTTYIERNEVILFQKQFATHAITI